MSGNRADDDAAYAEAARRLGWKWAAAFDGLINEEFRNGPDWKDYEVAADPEEACFKSGVETRTEAMKIVGRQVGGVIR